MAATAPLDAAPLYGGQLMGVVPVEDSEDES